MSIFEDYQIFTMHAVDNHTLHELQILPGNSRMPCILNFFDHTKTPGGRDFLKQLISKRKFTRPPVFSGSIENGQFECRVMGSKNSQVIYCGHRGLSLHKCFVIIDELFRGTNQEDARRCSETVLTGFLDNPDSFFFVSTHLHELVDIHENSDQVLFSCFKTKILEYDFENTFQIESGVAIEKLGALIMEKTGAAALLKHKKSPSPE